MSKALDGVVKRRERGNYRAHTFSLSEEAGRMLQNLLRRKRYKNKSHVAEEAIRHLSGSERN